MGMPGGKLMWGQPGEYNAVDDRTVIATLATAARKRGLVQVPTMTAGSGLTLTLGPWSALVNVADGSTAVIGNRDSASYTLLAGGASARTDVLWADVDPDGAASWTPTIITLAQTVNRLGVLLGLITVPANANTAAAMTFNPWEPPMQLGDARTSFAQSGGSGQSTTSWNTRTQFRIPPRDITPGSIYELQAWGNGWQPSGSAAQLNLQGFYRAAAPGTPFTEGPAGLGGSSLSFTGNSMGGSGSQFRWRASVWLICISISGTTGQFTDRVECLVTNASAGSQSGNLAPANNNFAIGGISPTAQGGTYTLDTDGSVWVHVRESWATMGSGTAPYLVKRWAMFRKIAGAVPLDT